MNNFMFITRVMVLNFSKKDTQLTCSAWLFEKQVLSKVFCLMRSVLFLNSKSIDCVLVSIIKVQAFLVKLQLILFA